MFGLLMQKYEVERVLWGLDALRNSFPRAHYLRGLAPPRELRRIDFVRGNVIRQMQQQGAGELADRP